MRAIDWASTPLGPVEGWSQALRTMVGLLLRNRFAMLLWWGPQFVQLYNDAYRPVLGDKHPRAMGQPTAECWAEIWHIIGPMVEAPFRGEPATWSDDLALLINRRGFLEETHFVVAYSPVPDDTVEGTGIGGVLATVSETTEQVYGERQLRTLRELGARAAEAKTAEQACQLAGAVFDEEPVRRPVRAVLPARRRGRHARGSPAASASRTATPSGPRRRSTSAPIRRRWRGRSAPRSTGQRRSCSTTSSNASARCRRGAGPSRRARRSRCRSRLPTRRRRTAC